jgi:hypothetical protein
MKVCKAFQTYRRQWQARYKELEKQQAEAIQQEQWERAERLGDKLVDLESNSAFSKCFNCGKRGCPGYPDGIAVGEAN